MLDKLCERKAGYLGFWAGNFKDVEDFYKYIQSFYCIKFFFQFRGVNDLSTNI